MQVRLHKNATTTPKTRKFIQSSNQSVCELSESLGVNETTIRRWKSRDFVTDVSHTRHNLGQKTSPEEEEIIIELKQKVRLSLDDITEVMKRCVNPNLSRSSIYRCLRRRNAHVLINNEEENDETNKFEQTKFGYVHIDLKHLTSLEKKRSYVFVAIERTTRFVYIEIIYNRDGNTIAACLRRFLDSFEGKVHTILTDNGSEFTDRFAVYKKGKPDGKPSGNHPFDVICQEFSIVHKLTKPFHPQTNGMVERFNRRISQAIKDKAFIEKNQGRNKFHSHEERNSFLFNFVCSYNRTRLRCLGYNSPFSILANHAEQNTRRESSSLLCHERKRASWIPVFTGMTIEGVNDNGR